MKKLMLQGYLQVSKQIWPPSAYLISDLFGFFFSAGTVFFSHNNSAGTVFSTKFSQANGAMVQKEEKFSIF